MIVIEYQCYPRIHQRFLTNRSLLQNNHMLYVCGLVWFLQDSDTYIQQLPWQTNNTRLRVSLVSLQR